MIDVKNMMREMNTGRPFEVTVVTYSVDKKAGGDIRTMQCKVLQPKDVLGREPTEVEKKLLTRRSSKPYIRHVALLVDGHPVDQVRTIRIPLVLQFNGEEVKM
jgi:hypothetical protein